MRPTALLYLAPMLGVALAGSPVPARAAPVSWQFSGVVTQSEDQGTVPLGTPFSGTFSYESTLSPDNTTPEEADYSFASVSEGSLTIDIGGFLGFESDASDLQLALAVLDDFEQCESFTGPDVDCDGYDVFDENSVILEEGEPTGGRTVVALKLFDTSQTAVTSFALPEAAPSLALFDDPHVAMFLFSPGSGPGIVGEVTALVPEPSTGMLVAVGIGLLGAARSRRLRSGSGYRQLPRTAPRRGEETAFPKTGSPASSRL
jgi:hypothetical protein